MRGVSNKHCLLTFFIVFALFLLIFLPLPLFLPTQILSTTGRIVLKFEDMVDMDVNLCNRVLKFKMWGSKASPWVCPKL